MVRPASGVGNRLAMTTSTAFVPAVRHSDITHRAVTHVATVSHWPKACAPPTWLEGLLHPHGRWAAALLEHNSR